MPPRVQGLRQEGPLRGGGRRIQERLADPQEGSPKHVPCPPCYTDPQGRLGTISSSSPLTPHSLGGGSDSFPRLPHCAGD